MGKKKINTAHMGTEGHESKDRTASERVNRMVIESGPGKGNKEVQIKLEGKVKEKLLRA